MEEYWGRSPAYNLLQELKLPLREDVAHSSVRIAGRLYPYTGEGDRDTYLKGIFNDRERAAWILWSQKNWQFYRRLHESFYAGKALPAELRPLMKLSFAAYITSFVSTDIGRGNAWSYTVAILTLIIAIFYMKLLYGRGDVRS